MKLNEEEFKKLEKPSYDLEKEEENNKDNLLTAYKNIIDILKEYVDLKEEYYNIVALWIIGTYFHQQFSSYPFLFFNAQKGSGKSRIMNLITTLSKDGSVQNSMTEAVLFRTNGTLGIDEYEGITKKGSENLRELLNSSYKRGTKVKRMKQQKTIDGVEQVIEEFDVYRPILIANIWGMESVLGDRCITLILEKSNKKEIINLLEIFNEDEMVEKTKELLKKLFSVVISVVSKRRNTPNLGILRREKEKCSLCSYSKKEGGVYEEWNNYIKNNYTNYINNTNYNNYTNYTKIFKKISSMNLNGRELELSFPLCLIASEIEFDVLTETTRTLKEIFNEKRAEELIEDKDVSLIDFVSQEVENHFKSINKITEEFKQFLNITDEWINSKWMGRALKRLNLFKEKRRTGRGIEVILNIKKAQEKIKMFK